MKKVAMVFDGLGFGGIERVGIDYVKIFQNLGYEVDIYNLQPKLKDMYKEYPQDCVIREYNMPLYLLPSLYMLMVKRWSWGKYLYPFICIFCNICLFICRLFTKKHKKYDIAIAFSGHLRDLTFVSNNFLKTEKKMCWLHGALFEYLLSACTYGDLYRKIKNLCVLSTDNQDYTLNLHRYMKGLNINKIYNAIPDNKREIDEKISDELKKKYGKYLLMVGRFEKDKDQKTVLKAIKILNEKYNECPKMVLVGGGSTLEECKEYAQKLGVSSDVVFTGKRYDVQNFYNSAFLFVHSSPAEGLPTVLLEAMQYGLPVVATDSPPGVSEILQDDIYGQRCKISDPEDMADKIHYLMNNEEQREKYIKSGYKRLEDFSYSAISKRLESIINSLI